MNGIKYKLEEKLQFNGLTYKVTSINISLHNTEILFKKAVAKIEINLDQVEPEVEPEVTTDEDHTLTGTTGSQEGIDYL